MSTQAAPPAMFPFTTHVSQLKRNDHIADGPYHSSLQPLYQVQGPSSLTSMIWNSSKRKYHDDIVAGYRGQVPIRANTALRLLSWGKPSRVIAETRDTATEPRNHQHSNLFGNNTSPSDQNLQSSAPTNHTAHSKSPRPLSVGHIVPVNLFELNEFLFPRVHHIYDMFSLVPGAQGSRVCMAPLGTCLYEHSACLRWGFALLCCVTTTAVAGYDDTVCSRTFTSTSRGALPAYIYIIPGNCLGWSGLRWYHNAYLWPHTW